MTTLSDIGKAAKQQQQQRDRHASAYLASGGLGGAATGAYVGRPFGAETAGERHWSTAERAGRQYGEARAGKRPTMGDWRQHMPQDPPRKVWDEGAGLRHPDPGKQRRVDAINELRRRGSTQGERDAATHRLRQMGLDPDSGGKWREVPGGPKRASSRAQHWAWQDAAHSKAHHEYRAANSAWDATRTKYAGMGKDKLLAEHAKIGGRKGALAGAGIGAAAGLGVGALSYNQRVQRDRAKAKAAQRRMRRAATG